jgi:UTP:GlnB (protein PII) uridylyltransferase
MRRDVGRVRTQVPETLGPARRATFKRSNVAIIGDVSMRINDEEILSVAYDEDLEAELEDERYQRALRRLTVSDVLATVDDLIAQRADEHRHPLYSLTKAVLTHGGFRSSGKRAAVAEHIAAACEDLVETAIQHLINEELSLDGPWEE